MALYKLSFTLALALPALAIPPPDFGFPEQSNQSNVVVEEAALYGIDIPQHEPRLSLNTSAYQSLAEYNGTYAVLMVDPDASYPERPTNRFVLHWMQPNFTQASEMHGARELRNTSSAVVPYRRPSPPSNSSSHRYIIYAFHQPANFSIPPQWTGLSNSNRTRFNLTNFINDTGLGEPAAANYFYVSNQTAVPANFTAAPGGQYPNGDGTAVTSGDPYGSAVPAATSAPTSSSTALAAKITGAGSLVGAGIVGLAALL